MNHCRTALTRKRNIIMITPVNLRENSPENEPIFFVKQGFTSMTRHRLGVHYTVTMKRRTMFRDVILRIDSWVISCCQRYRYYNHLRVEIVLTSSQAMGYRDRIEL